MSFQKTISIYLRRARRKVCDAYFAGGKVCDAFTNERTAFAVLFLLCIAMQAFFSYNDRIKTILEDTTMKVSVIQMNMRSLESKANFDRAEALAEFIARYYKEGAEVPDEIVVNAEGDFSLLEEYFKEKSGKIVNILCPKMGVRKQLSEMAEKNAADYLEKTVGKIRHKEDRTVLACRRLQEALRLSRYPRRMECYDISHISGVDKVGSMVVFADGEPERDSYRRFKIRTVEGSNDFACLQEVLKRRLGKLGTEEEERFPRPDLIVIDGGKGQLSSVKEIFDGMGVEGIDLVSLAKREEEVFTLFSRESVRLDHSDYALQVLQRLRDEAHRFAITYHRTLRGKRSLSSVLDGIEGIGRKRRMALMERFKDIYEIEKASVSQLTEVAGIGKKQAEAIVAYFSKEENHEI